MQVRSPERKRNRLNKSWILLNNLNSILTNGLLSKMHNDRKYFSQKVKHSIKLKTGWHQTVLRLLVNSHSKGMMWPKQSTHWQNFGLCDAPKHLPEMDVQVLSKSFKFCPSQLWVNGVLPWGKERAGCYTWGREEAIHNKHNGLK